MKQSYECGLWVSMIAALGGAAMMVCSCASDGDEKAPSAAAAAVEAPAKTLITTPGGVEGVAPIEANWVVGEWQHVVNPMMQIEIAATDKAGSYEWIDLTGQMMAYDAMTLFEIGPTKFAELSTTRPDGEAMYLYAVVNGHGERLSIDIMAAICPQAWNDPEFSRKCADGEVPIAGKDRAKALVKLAARLPEDGTFMHQDLSFYRRGAVE